MLVQAYCDGASRGQGIKRKPSKNPEDQTPEAVKNGQLGEAACAAVIFKNGKEVARYARGLGKRTNNQAEYEAVITALLICSMADLIDPIIYSDSAVVVNQVSGKWDCRSDELLPLFLSIKEIQSEFRFRIQQVPRITKGIALADLYANEFLDQLALAKQRAKR